MGAGSSLEAAYTLQGPIAAGTWRLIADGIILEQVDVRFELIWRHDGEDDVLATFMQSFEPLPNAEYRAQPYEEAADVAAVDASAGDQLVFRYAGTGSALDMAYIPNGDGAELGGRIPFIELPP